METTVTISAEQWQALLDALVQLKDYIETLSYFLSILLFALLFAVTAVMFWKTIFRE